MITDRKVHIVSLASADRAEQARLCFAVGYHAEIYGNYEELVAAAPRNGLVLAQDLPERGGIAALFDGLETEGVWLPIIATGSQPDPHRVVAAVKAGAVDYLALPLDPLSLAAILRRAHQEACTIGAVQRQAVQSQARLNQLSGRETEVLELLVRGLTNKAIARSLEISPRTVEIHRANMMGKLGATSVADAVRIRIEASLGHGAASRAGIGGLAA